jgi:hypothetical protein
MRFSTVLVTSSLILSGFAAAQRFGDYDVYARSFDADAIAELHARSYVDDDVGLYLRSVMAEGADPAGADPASEQNGSNEEPPTEAGAPPQSDIATGGESPSEPPSGEPHGHHKGGHGHGKGGHGKGPKRGGKGGHHGGGGHGRHHKQGHHGGNRHGGKGGKGGASGGRRRQRGGA